MIRAALADAAQRLAGVSDTARLDAELLMAHALGVARNELLLKHLDDSVPSGFEPLLRRRLTHEPVAYITGTRAFWTIELQVGPGALIPRPDSETLIEAAIEHFDERAPLRILDLGTGPGTLLRRARRPSARSSAGRRHSRPARGRSGRGRPSSAHPDYHRRTKRGAAPRRSAPGVKDHRCSKGSDSIRRPARSALGEAQFSVTTCNRHAATQHLGHKCNRMCQKHPGYTKARRAVRENAVAQGFARA